MQILSALITLPPLAHGCLAAGVVEQIHPMRTVVRTDSRLPVYINNKARRGPALWQSLAQH